MSKNLLYIGGFDLPDNNAAAQRVISNAKIFRELGYRVILNGRGTASPFFLYEGFYCKNLQYPKSLREWYCYLVSIDQITPLIDSYLPRIVVAYNYPGTALNKLHKLCIKRNIRLIADCTEWYTPKGSFLFRLLKKWDTRKRMKVIHPKLDGIISISRFLDNYYINKGTRSLYLPPLVDIDQLKWKMNIVEETCVGLKLVYAGSPGFKDRLDIIVKSIANEKNYKVYFSVIGVDETQFKTLYKYTDPIPQNVQFMGRMPHEEVLKKLKNADFQIFIRDDSLSTKAGFPTKFVESISAGVPVLTNLTSNLSEFLSDGINGFVLDASSNESLQHSLDIVLMKTRKEIQSVKKSIDRRMFDYRCYVSKMREFLDSII